MRWRLARAHLGNPALPVLSVLCATVAAFEPALAMPDSTAPLRSAFSVAGFWLLLTAAGVAFLLPAAETVFEQTLPLHTRVLREGKWLAACVVLGVPIIAWRVSAYFLLPATPSIAAVVSLLAAAAMFAMLLYFTTDTGPRLLPRASLRAEIALRAVLLSAACATPLYLFSTGLAAATLCVLVVPVYAVLAGQIPASLPLASHQSNAASVAPANTTRVRKPENRVTELLLLARTATPGPMLLIPLFVALTAYGDGFNSFFLFFYPMVLVPSTMPRLQWLAALPFSASQRAALRYGPTLLLCVVVFAITDAVRDSSRPDRYSLSSRSAMHETPNRWFASPTEMALVHWQPTTAAHQPIITAPWGETVAADTVTTLGISRFNPYTSRKSSSARFIDWQFTRATQATYGESFTQAQYAELPASDRPRVMTRSPRAVLFGYTLLVLQLVLGFWLAEAFLRPSNRGRWVMVLLLSGIFLSWLWFTLPNEGSRFIADKLMLTLLETLPSGWPASIATALATVFAAWCVLVWQSKKSEWRQ